MDQLSTGTFIKYERYALDVYNLHMRFGIVTNTQEFNRIFIMWLDKEQNWERSYVNSA